MGTRFSSPSTPARLTVGNAFPLLLELGAPELGVVAVRGRVDGREVDGAVLDAHLRHGQRLDAAHALDPADPLDDLVGQRVGAEDQDVGAAERSLRGPDAVGRLGGRLLSPAWVARGGRRTARGRRTAAVVVAAGREQGAEEQRGGRRGHRPARSPAHRTRVGAAPTPIRQSCARCGDSSRPLTNRCGLLQRPRDREPGDDAAEDQQDRTGNGGRAERAVEHRGVGVVVAAETDRHGERGDREERAGPGDGVVEPLAMPAFSSGAAASTVAVSGATISANPRPNTVRAGSRSIQ